MCVFFSMVQYILSFTLGGCKKCVTSHFTPPAVNVIERLRKKLIEKHREFK